MSLPDPNDLAHIDRFNDKLASIGCTARVALPQNEIHLGVLEFHDGNGDFLDFIPASTEPRMAAIAHAMHERAFRRGVRAGEEGAWAKLRTLIGAAPSFGPPTGARGGYHA